MAETPIYGLPYQTVDDPPNGPTLGQDLAEAVETELARIDQAVSAIPPAPDPYPGTWVARLRRSSTSTITQSTAIPWDAEDFDLLNGHSTSSNTTRYTPTVGGAYLVMAVVQHQAVTAGAAIFCWIGKNGLETTARVNGAANTSPSAGNGLFIADVVVLNGTTDYIEVAVGNNQAVNVNCSGSVLNIIYLG